MIYSPSNARGSAHALYAAERPEPTRPLEQTAAFVARLLLMVLAVLPAWCFGGVLPGAATWSLAAVLLVLGCALLCLAVQRRRSTILPWALVPLLAALALGAVQLLPLGPRALTTLSPRAAELRHALDDAHSAAERSMRESVGAAPLDAKQPLSLDPSATRHDLALLALAVGVFVGGAFFFRTPTVQMWLCAAIAVNGGVLAFYQLLQVLLHGTGWRITWTEGQSVVLPGVQLALGPLVNRNNAGGFMNLCLAGGLGMLLWAVGRLRSAERGRWELAIVSASLASLAVAGVFCAFSRGAIVAMLLGSIFLTGVLTLPRKSRTAEAGWGAALTLLLGAGLVAWVGMTGHVAARIGSLANGAAAKDLRPVNWTAALRVVPDFWPLGSGLGTYRSIYRLYERPAIDEWFYHAENQPLEALVDGGVIGLALLAAAWLTVALAAWQLQKQSADHRTTAFAGCVLFALVTQTVHGLFDFGLYIPSNAMLFALLCGAAAGSVAGWPSRAIVPNRVSLPWLRHLAGAGALVVVLVSCGWAWADTRRSENVETALRRTASAAVTANTPAETLQQGLDRLTQGLALCPDNAEAHLRACRWWINLYRVRRFAQLRAASAAAVKDETLWALTTTLAVHGQGYALTRGQGVDAWEQWRAQPLYRECLLPALRHALEARHACPLIADVHLSIAQLCGLVAPLRHDEVHLERARLTAPKNAELRYWIGLLEMQAGRTEQACADWREVLAQRHGQSSPRTDDVLRVATGSLAAWQVVERLLPDSPALLVRVARQWYAGASHARTRAALAGRIESIVGRPGYREDEQAYYRGMADELRGDVAAAIERYSRAVELDPRAIAWRYQLAVLLHGAGRDGEAHEHARRCALREPENAEYRQLLQQIHHAQLISAAH